MAFDVKAWSDRFGGLYWVAGAHVGALLAGLLNAWIFLLVAGAQKEQSGGEAT